MGGKHSMGAALLVAAVWMPLLAAAQAPSPIRLRTAAQEGSEPKFLAAGTAGSPACASTSCAPWNSSIPACASSATSSGSR